MLRVHGGKDHDRPFGTLEGVDCSNGHAFPPVHRNPPAGTGIADFAHLSAKRRDNPNDLLKGLTIAGFEPSAVFIKPGGDCLSLKQVGPTADRRGFVAVDVQGEIYALSRWIGVKTKDVNDRLGSPSALPSVQEVKKSVRSLVTQQLLTFIADVKAKHAKDAAPLLAEKAVLVAAQKAERVRLAEGQAKRWQVESQERSDRLRSGLRGLLDAITGRAKAVREANALEAFRCAQRDQRQRDSLVLAQIDDRQGLQKRFDALKKKQIQDRRLLARDVTQFLRASARRSETGADRAQEATRPRDGGRNRGPRFEL